MITVTTGQIIVLALLWLPIILIGPAVRAAESRRGGAVTVMVMVICVLLVIL